MSDPTSFLPQALHSAEQVRELDRLCMDEFDIRGWELMQKAGAAAFEVLTTTWPKARNILVLCGGGNNGGDGYVLARLAYESGYNVRLLQFGDHSKLKGDAKTAADALLSSGLIPEPCQNIIWGDTDVVVDALLGTGLDRDITGELRALIEAVSGSGIPVLSIDIPSGLHADTGQDMGATVSASVTITFIGLKLGLFTHQGRKYAGKIIYDDLDTPGELRQKLDPLAVRMDYDLFSSVMTKRSATAHKGHFGHVLIIGGDAGFTGAIHMAGEAAARTGAGLVSLATRNSHAAMINTARPELMSHGVENPDELIPLLERATVVAIGPGLGQSAWACSMFSKVLEFNRPMVVDADALNLLAQEPCHRSDWILTPHPGEAARLSGVTPGDIQKDRVDAATRLQKKYGGIIVLKGSGTLVLDMNKHCFICSDGNPGMASGGMGDVLTGIIAGLIAQKVPLDVAAKMGVCLHARAGDRAAADGEIGLLASDLMPWIRSLVNPSS